MSKIVSIFGGHGDEPAPVSLEKPWIQRQGNKIVRYVQPHREDRWLKFLRSVYNSDEFYKTMEKKLDTLGRELMRELQVLRSLGVVVAETHYAVEEIPVFEAGNPRPVKTHVGLKLVSEFIDGQRADMVDPSSKKDKQMYTDALMVAGSALYRYTDHAQATNHRYLGDIFDASQFMYDGTQLVLVDVDPYYHQPVDVSIAVSRVAIDLFFYTGHE